jgi:secreted trypsin-like serine protease
VGGVPVASIDDFPYFATNSFSGRCGAALIAPNILITAAHCSSTFSIGQTVYIGITTLLPILNNRESIKIVARLRHPNFDSVRYDNDVMLLQLESSSTAPLVTLNTNPNVPATGDLVTAIGFGRTSYLGPTSSTLLQMSVPVTSESVCASAFQGFSVCTFTNATIKLCAGGDIVDSCTGDSGGPLLHGSSNTLVGIVSCGKKCAEPGYPGVYTRVTGVMDFVRQGACELLQDDNGVYDLPWSCAPTISPAPCPAPSPAPSPEPSPEPSTAPTSACIDHQGYEGTFLAWDFFGLVCYDLGCVTFPLWQFLFRVLLARSGHCP